jgi:hypothetical protein
MRRFVNTLLAASLWLIVPAAAAQSVGAIEIGGTVQGAVTADDPAPSFFFETTGPAALLARVQVSPDALTPVLLAADSANRVISTVSASPGMRVLESQFSVAGGGRYFVQVQGLNGTQGVFSLTLLDVNAATATPTSAPPTAMPTPQPPAPAQSLRFGETITAEVSAAAPEQRFALIGAAGGQVIRIETEPRGDFTIPAFTLLNEGGEVVATLAGDLRGAALVLPAAAGEDFTLVAAHRGGDAQPFLITQLDMLTWQNPAQPGLPPPPTQAAVLATPTNTPPPAPVDVDLLLRWDGTALMMTNVSGAPADITDVSMSGNNRRVDSSYWARSNPSLNLAALPANSCVGLRPLAYPDAPPLPPGCNDLAAWWSADIVYVWGGETFDVYVNGALAATCPSSAGQCGIDLAAN